MQELAKRLTDAFGVSGFEEEIRSLIRSEVADLVDDVRVDALGNLVTMRRGAGGGKKVMLAAHMDQIGLIVTHVDEKGYLRFAPVGYLYMLALWGNQVRFADGTIGAIGLDGRVNPTKGLPTVNDLYVDVGASSRAEVKQKVGDVATFMFPFQEQGNAWFSPNHDDRVGCLILIEVLRALKGRDVAHDVYGVFTTQEEVGPRGATTSAYAIEPDIAIALDVTDTGDTPHATPPMEVYLGRGAAIKVQDSGMISHRGLNRLLVQAAEAEGVPYQMEILQGGTTDAYSMQIARGGAPTSAISVPSRYIHTPTQLVDARDVRACVDLLAAFLSRPIEL